MQASEDQLLSEKKKRQSEMDDKRRQLEDDRRELQHLKLKALRERWLLDGAPPAGTPDAARTRNLEETINRLENELLHLETRGVSPAGCPPAGEVRGHDPCEDQGPAAEVKGHMLKSPREVEQLKRAMYSVEITVERDRVTGATRVLSTNTKLPVDLSQQGVIVYEDAQKVVHEMNGEAGVQPLSSSEVDELLLQAEEALMMSPTSAVVTSLQTAEVGDEAAPPVVPLVGVEAGGLGASPELEPGGGGAGEEKAVTMVFMGYQSVEHEDQEEMVKAELVLLTEATTPPDEGKEEVSLLPPPPTPPQALVEPELLRAGAEEQKKEKQLCVCCSIM